MRDDAQSTEPTPVRAINAGLVKKAEPALLGTPDIPFHSYLILKFWSLKNVFPSGDDPLSGKPDENGDQTDSLSLGKDALSEYS